MLKLLRIWLRLAVMSMLAQLTYRIGAFGFLVGKLIRLFFFFAYVIAIFNHTESVAGYSLIEVALFFLTFNIVDITIQIFCRGVYGARRTVIDGDLDTYLTQPCPALFRMVFTSMDFLDVLTLLPVLVMTIEAFSRLPVAPAWTSVALYGLLTLNGVAIAFAIHVFVAALAVRTQELDNAIWLYRDMMFLGKFPSDVYHARLQWVLMTAIPIAVMVSFPAKALLGRLSPAWITYSFALAALSLGTAVWFWKDSLRRYTSVSS